MRIEALNPEYERYQPEEAIGLQVLRARGKEGEWPHRLYEYESLKAIESLSDLPEDFWQNPFLLKDMEEAVNALLPIIKNRSKILIHGDYDCDGITATVILYRFLSALQVPVSYYIPDRLSEGYGLSEAGVKKAIDEAVSAVITVDCGVQSFSEVAAIETAGIVTIVTDHHACLADLPKAHAVINPNRMDEGTVYKMLAGAGVALKLTQALSLALDRPKLWLDGLQLAALGTIADLMLLEGENRRIVLAGVKSMKMQAICGLQALLNQINVLPDQVSAKTLGYSLAPRINACGRMGTVEPALRLLLSDEEPFCQKEAEAINLINQERQQVEQAVSTEALRFFTQKPEYLDSKILLVYGEDWQPGVVGIVATRMVDYFQRPCIVLTRSKGEGYKGSARSVKGVDILSCLKVCSQYLTHYGGHSGAAGLELSEEQLLPFAKALREHAKSLSLSDVKDSLHYDLCLSQENLDLSMLDSLDVLEPFGKANPQPLFYLENERLRELRAVGKEGQHLRLVMEAKEGGTPISGIGFGLAAEYEHVGTSSEVSLLAHFQRNHFRNRESLDLMVLAIEDSRADLKEQDQIESQILQLEHYFPKWTASQLAAPFAIEKERLVPGAEELRAVYKQVLAMGIEKRPLLIDEKTLRSMAQDLGDLGLKLGTFIVKACLSMYEEAGLLSSLDWRKDEAAEAFHRCYNLQKTTDKVHLYETGTYKKLTS